MNSVNCSIALFVVFAIPSIGKAHGLGIAYSFVNRTVVVEARFDSDDPADDCEISVTKADGREIAKGMTDKNGRFTFLLPEPGEYRIVADAGAGHRAKKSLTVTTAEPAVPVAPVNRSFAWLWTPFGVLLIGTGTAVWMRYAQVRRRANSA